MEHSKGLFLGFVSVVIVFLFLGVFSITQALPDGGVDDWVLGAGNRSNGTVLWHPAHGKVDDWALRPSEGAYDRAVNMIASPSVGGGLMMKAESLSSGRDLGFSVGGAKDINNFRENIKNGFLPLPTDITYEGLFYDYFFDTGKQEVCDSLFCPSYSYAVSKDPFSKKGGYYLAVGLNSGMKEKDFKRKKLNLVIVLDISGSMSSPFNRYYYDRFGRRVELDGGEEAGQTKIRLATKSVAALLDHLEDDDRVGIVLFNDDAALAKPLSRVGDTDMEKIKGHVMEITADGSTQMSAGMRMASKMLKEYAGSDPGEYESRIIFLTDAMPNVGETSEEGLLGMTEKNAENRVYTTFIGMGVDFNTELVDYITKIRGANYYSVHSAREFRERMDEGFDYMVTPLVFNLKLSLDADGWEIEKVYGSPEADEATGELMKVNTLFPSKTEGGETKGGLVLLKLRKTSDDPGKVNLKVTYEDRNGDKRTVRETVEFVREKPEFFGNSGIRKGILLSRYADLMKNWIIDERQSGGEEPVKPCVDYERGITVPEPYPQLGKWERQSVPLHVSGHYKRLFWEFKSYFEGEMDAMGDDSLKQEMDILSKLGGYEDGVLEKGD